MSDAASESKVAAGGGQGCQLTSRRGAFLGALGVLCLLSWQLVSLHSPDDQQRLEKRINDRIENVESKTQLLAEQLEKISAHLQLEQSSPSAQEEEVVLPETAVANTADASTPALSGAGAQSHLHTLVLQKEAKINAAFKNGVAEECKTALSRKGFKDDPFGPELWVRVLKEHHRSGGGDCRNSKDRNCRGFVSQGLQDVFLYTVLWRHLSRPGVYVDLAAHDFRYISNTYFADHCLKFDGVCIEPNSDYHSELITKRRCAVVKTCIAEQKKDVTFVLQGPFGGIESERKVLKKTATGGKRTTMTCQTLSDVFKAHGMTHVDFMSLDVEGAELACLEGIDWNLVSIDTILVEGNDNSFQKVAELLTSQGYVNATQLHRDVFFVHRSMTGLLQKVEVWNREVCPRINEALRPGRIRYYSCP
ncbi:unnamed protein product [Symbiodinium sp. CCMP2592]|nr:unnamed protein product [Symbiodinium sp. CCMP2592]